MTSGASPNCKTRNGIAILKLIHEFRFVRCEDIAELAGRHHMSIYHRLFKLAQARYVTVTRLPLQKHVYGLGSRAVPVLVEQGIASPDLLTTSLRTGELTKLFFKHEMMLVDLHVMLTRASRRSDAPLELADGKREGNYGIPFHSLRARVKSPCRFGQMLYFVCTIGGDRQGTASISFSKLTAQRKHRRSPKPGNRNSSIHCAIRP